MPTKQYKDVDFKIDLINKRGGACEICGSGLALDLHHCIEKRRKGHPELDCEINLEVVCHKGHMEGRADSKEHAIEFVKKQIERGHDVVSWYDNLKLITRRFPNLKGMIFNVDKILKVV